MKILGVDPGLRITGYGVIEVRRGPKDVELKLLEAGVIKTPPKGGIGARLEKIHRGLSEVIDELKPDCLVIERLYAHYKHPATAILMGHARGVVLVALSDRHYLPRILAIGDKLTEFKGAALVLQDVTKFRLLDDAKTNLVGTVSHELKTPLTSLRMAVYLLLEQKLEAYTPTQRELLESARDDADRLLEILENLLDLARLEAGASTLNRREMTVAELLDRAAYESRGFIELRGLTLAVLVAPELADVRIMVDPERLHHVFMNLLTNAAKYSPAHGVVTLAATAETGFVRFAVCDRGSGIPAESVARVFDRFYRAPDQEKSGAGLGLAIAREIVVAHGGSIACESAVGKGAEFYFLLPRSAA